LSLPSRGTEINPVLVDRGAAFAHLFDEFEQRASKRNKRVELVPAEMGGAGCKEGFSLPIGETDNAVGVDHDHRVLDGVEHHAGGVCFNRGNLIGKLFTHAALSISEGELTAASSTSAKIP
jgi:hypothetical protein